MITNYEPAQIIDLAEPQGFICGEKWIIDSMDWITGDWSTIYIFALDTSED